MIMIIGTIAWAFAAFVILHDNARTRRDLKAYEGQFNGNMKSFWARLFESEKSAKIEIERVNTLVKDLSDLARRTGTEDRKLEQKVFFEISELRGALAQNVDNMADRNAAFENAMGNLHERLSSVEFDRTALVAKKKMKKAVVRKASTKGSRARA